LSVPDLKGRLDKTFDRLPHLPMKFIRIRNLETRHPSSIRSTVTSIYYPNDNVAHSPTSIGYSRSIFGENCPAWSRGTVYALLEFDLLFLIACVNDSTENFPRDITHCGTCHVTILSLIHPGKVSGLPCPSLTVRRVLGKLFCCVRQRRWKVTPSRMARS